MPKNELAEQRKQLILQKAQKLFEENGFDRTSMQDIARACKFEASNLYNYFKSKERILYEIYVNYNRAIMPFLVQLEGDDSRSPEERLNLFVRSHLQAELAQIGPCGNLFESEIKRLAPAHRRRFVQDRERYMSVLSAIVKECVKSGCFREVDPKLAALCIVAMIMRARLWYSPAGKFSIDQIADLIISISLDGLRAHDGLRKTTGEELVATTERA